MLASSAIHAGDMGKPKLDWLSGVYVGGEIGYDYAKVYNNYEYSFTTSHGPSVTTGFNHLAATGFVGGGFIGYRQTVHDIFYWGVEILGNGSTASGVSESVYTHSHASGAYDSNGYNSAISIKNNFGASFLPGIKLNKSASLYGRIGYSQAHIKGNDTLIFYSEPLGVPQSRTPHTFSSSPNGLSYGLGFEAAVTHTLGVRADVIHTDYQSFKTSLSNRISVSDNQAMIGFIYHFNQTLMT